MPIENRLLSRLPAADYTRLAESLEPVSLPLRMVLYRAFTPIDYVYFPTGGVLSAMTVMLDGSAIEVATIGNEGMAGVVAFVGGESSPNEVMVQVEATALRMTTEALQAEVKKDGALRRLLALYHSVFHTQISFSVACNGLHKIEQRCCRWLLMTQDRVGGNEVPLTHEYLGVMLGVRRSSVTEVLLPLQKKNLIANDRGKIIILDRPGMEKLSCECYRRVKEEFERVLG